MTQPPPPVPDRSSIQTNAIVLIVVGFLCGVMIPAIFGIVALVQLDSDPESARRMNRIGWIICAVLVGVTLLAVVATFVIIPVIFGVALFPVLLGG